MDQKPTKATTNRPVNNIAKQISKILQPAITVPTGTTITGLTVLGRPQGLLFILFTAILPVALVLTLAKTGILESKDVPKIKTRLKLLTALITLETIATIIYHQTPELHPVFEIQLALTITLTALTLATIYTKVSIHCAVIATFGTLWATQSPITLIATIPLLTALAWSRITLKAHTPTQTILGTLLPIVCITISVSLQG